MDVSSTVLLCFLAVIFTATASSSSSSKSNDFRRAFPIVKPDPDHLRLRLAREGLDAIQNITTPVAVVAVVYRSTYLVKTVLTIDRRTVASSPLSNLNFSTPMDPFHQHPRSPDSHKVFVTGSVTGINRKGESHGCAGSVRNGPRLSRIFLGFPNHDLKSQVIGPYRSGKSFLLNQLLSLPCDEGFEVGHMRDAKTKGLWVWGTPVELVIDGSKVSVLYIDTEGFENVGNSNVYDERIFALATLISSVLIYNIPETVREADISRLSFAVEIADEFYARSVFKELMIVSSQSFMLICHSYREKRLHSSLQSSCGSSNEIFCKGALFKKRWMKHFGQFQMKVVNLIHCLFHVHLTFIMSYEVTKEFIFNIFVIAGDENIDKVNKIRKSLAIMANDISAFGLPQPHLQRIRLCDIKDSELDPLYVQKREQFKQLVESIIRPKIVQGNPLNGKEFIAFLEQTLDALNEGEIPSTGSIAEVFNKEILERCLKLYSKEMSNLQLPVPGDKLLLAHEVSKEKANNLFDQQYFGWRSAKQSLLNFNNEIKKVYDTHVTENKYLSIKLCEASWSECEDRMDGLLVTGLPSMRKFNASFDQCNEHFERDCVGPSKEKYALKMVKMLQKCRSLFTKEYYRRLTFNLLLLSTTIPVVGHVVKLALFRYCGYFMVTFSLYLEMYTRLYGSAQLLRNSPSFQIVETVWEMIVGNTLVLNRQVPQVLLFLWAIVVAISQCVALLGWLFYKQNIVGRMLLPFKVVLGLPKAALVKSGLRNNPRTQ
ncbi:GTP binding protein [Musa troglodytarum]|uniref:GTP binding protein n=1 Tax=Musa troglodytarum TaxID=320322 RepID=A0A9E7FM61_9LILI|nr:GTP binding protein [Musa troglodytarum]